MSMLDILDKPPMFTPDIIAAKAGAKLTPRERLFLEEIIVMYEKVMLVSDSDLVAEVRRRGIECADVAKPPLGLVPKWLRDEQRLAEIEAAMSRYRDAGKGLPNEWIAEHQTLEATLKSCHGQMAGADHYNQETQAVIHERVAGEKEVTKVHYPDGSVGVSRDYGDGAGEFTVKKEVTPKPLVDPAIVERQRKRIEHGRDLIMADILKYIQEELPIEHFWVELKEHIAEQKGKERPVISPEEAFSIGTRLEALEKSVKELESGEPTKKLLYNFIHSTINRLARLEGWGKARSKEDFMREYPMNVEDAFTKEPPAAAPAEDEHVFKFEKNGSYSFGDWILDNGTWHHVVLVSYDGTREGKKEVYFDGVQHKFFDPKASPQGVDFSIALQYLKAGRNVRLGSDTFVMTETGGVVSVDLHSYFPIGWQALMSKEWCILPEPEHKTQQP